MTGGYESFDDDQIVGSIMLPPFVRFHQNLCVALPAIDALAVDSNSANGHASVLLRSGLAFPVMMTISDAIDRIAEACFDFGDDSE